MSGLFSFGLGPAVASVTSAAAEASGGGMVDSAYVVIFYVSSAVFVTSALAFWLKYSATNAKTNGSANGNKASTQQSAAPKRVISVMFGTQTGTAERFAQQLSEEITERFGAGNVVGQAVDVETYDAKSKLANEELALFCMATYGDGEPTDSALSFTDWLNECVGESDKDGSEPLKSLKYGVFALGNTQYEHFCACGKLVDRQLKALGAQKVIERGEGDDDKNIEDDFAAWKDKLWIELDKLGYCISNGMNGTSTPKAKAKIPEEYVVEEVKQGLSVDFWAHDGSSKIASATPLKVNVFERKELHTQESERSCIHAEIDARGTDLKYETGDHVGIYATNPHELVSEALKRLNYDGKQGVKLTTKMGSKLPHTMFEGKAISIRDLFSHFLDIQSPPRKNSLLAMASCARDLKEQRRLEHLASSEGREEYRSYVLDDMRSLVEVLQDFPSVKPTLGVFAARIAPKLQPRFYSISSSSLAHPDKIHITCAVVEGESPTGRSHKGVASTWLSRCKPGTSKIPVFIRNSTFKMPKDQDTPIVMVGPGTGFAPFRGFLQEREAKMKMGETNLGEAHLYFGCRSKTKDFIYEEEIKAWKESNVITDLEYAFSRDQPQKVYVQDQIRKNGKKIYDLLFTSQPRAYLYVCGDAKLMARDVNITLHEIIQQYAPCNATEAELKIKAMQEEGRYLRDVW